MTNHIAQLNIGRFRYPTNDSRMAEFVKTLDRVNALAERSEGFVWRLDGIAVADLLAYWRAGHEAKSA